MTGFESSVLDQILAEFDIPVHYSLPPLETVLNFWHHQGECISGLVHQVNAKSEIEIICEFALHHYNNQVAFASSGICRYCLCFVCCEDQVHAKHLTCQNASFRVMMLSAILNPICQATCVGTKLQPIPLSPICIK